MDPICTETANEITRRAITKFPTRKVVSSFPDDIWSIDLVEMGSLKELNDDYGMILTCVDVFSRFAWARPLKSKSAEEVKAAIESIVKANNKETPRHLWTDQGKEFYNAKLTAWRKKNDVGLYSTYGPHKSAIVERFNRTLKTNMWREFVATDHER